MKTMAQILKAAREKKGWSLREAARQTGISPATISKLERGTLKNPTFVTIVILSNHLNIRGKAWEAMFSDNQ